MVEAMTLRHCPSGDGTHRFLREDGSEVIRIILPPRLSRAEKTEAVERLIAFAVAFVGAK